MTYSKLNSLNYRVKSIVNHNLIIMSIIILSHDVKDFASWKPHYDGDVARRENVGLKEIAVGTKSDDPNKVIMIWEGKSEGLDKMLQDPGLKEKMEVAGVLSPPEITIINT